MNKIFLNGKYVSLKNAKVSILDRGFLYGDGAFETMRSYNGRIFRLEGHLRRLSRGLKLMSISPPYDVDKLCSLVLRTLEANKLKNAYIKIIVTRGRGPAGIDIKRGAIPTTIIYTKPLSKFPTPLYEEGVKLGIAKISRNENSYTAQLKSLNYVDNILARHNTRLSGYDEALFLNSRKMVAEAATSNIFIVKNGRVITPPERAGLLPGITRKAVIELASKYLYNKVKEGNISLRVLESADEIFLTNSVLELFPVTVVGKRRIGNGKPGPFYRILHSLYKVEVGNV